ncbi:hypothetical protein CCACVL1_02773, partial [Corchorus capsularis]
MKTQEQHLYVSGFDCFSKCFKAYTIATVS